MVITALFIIAKKWKQHKCSSTDEYIKRNVAYPYTEILFGHKMEWNSYRCYSLNKPWKCYAKWKKPDTEGHIL